MRMKMTGRMGKEAVQFNELLYSAGFVFKTKCSPSDCVL